MPASRAAVATCQRASMHSATESLGKSLRQVNEDGWNPNCTALMMRKHKAAAGGGRQQMDSTPHITLLGMFRC